MLEICANDCTDLFGDKRWFCFEFKLGFRVNSAEASEKLILI